jgi:hypothetical protein
MMCQEIHLSDVRLALLDYCEGHDEDDEHPQPDDLLAQFDDSGEDAFAHALEHGRRARQLASLGDAAAAEIHEALFANMARRAVSA